MTVEETKIHTESTAPSIHSESVTSTPRRSLRGLLLLAFIVAVILGFALVNGLRSRAEAGSVLNRETQAAAVPTVAVVHPKLIGGGDEVILPGNMQAFIDTPLWARASGYLKSWYSDIGAHVGKGQLLAEIEAPEIDQQLQQAREQLITDQANLKLAEITADRYRGLLQQDSIAKQDVDTAVQNAAARVATVKSSEANVSRLVETVGYEKVYAPFDGIITARNIDVGGLVTAGSQTPGKELFHVASDTTLRVFVSVPEAYSQAAKPGVKAFLTLAEFPGRRFTGSIARNARSIDNSSRTLLVEVDVLNSTGELLPGSYVSVHLKLPSNVEALTVPSNALLFRAEGLQVAAVRNGRTQLVPVIPGRDFGDSVEIVHGLTSSETVIVNPSDSVTSGQPVTVEAPQAAAVRKS